MSLRCKSSLTRCGVRHHCGNQQTQSKSDLLFVVPPLKVPQSRNVARHGGRVTPAVTVFEELCSAKRPGLESEEGRASWETWQNAHSPSVADVSHGCKRAGHSFRDLRTAQALSIQLLNVKKRDSLGARSNHFYSVSVQINGRAPEPAASFC